MAEKENATTENFSRVGNNTLWFDELTSTNDRAKESDFGHGTVIGAESQSSGRGQRGNSWCSHRAENLTFTLILKPVFLSAEQQFLISKIAALAVSRTLDQLGVVTSIKWSNDIYAGNRKICGILIENDLYGTMMRRTLIGIGINVNQIDFPENLPNPTSLRVELKSATNVNRAEVLRRFYDNFMSLYDDLEEKKYQTIDTEYLRKMYRRDGKYYTFRRAGGNEFTAKIVGVESRGPLILETPGGFEEHFAFKEIEFIL